jgi:hypothetical protein
MEITRKGYSGPWDRRQIALEGKGKGVKGCTPHTNTVHVTNGDGEADGDGVVEVGGAGALLANAD